MRGDPVAVMFIGGYHDGRMINVPKPLQRTIPLPVPHVMTTGRGYKEMMNGVHAEFTYQRELYVLRHVYKQGCPDVPYYAIKSMTDEQVMAELEKRGIW